MPQIIIKNLKVVFNSKNDSVNAVDDLSTIFNNEKISVILGANGCGKTTLLKTIAGYYPYDGDILVDSIEYSSIPFENRHLSLVNQDFVIYPHMNIYDNLAFPLSIKKLSRQECDYEVKNIASELDILHLLSRKPKQISIGQQQRVALARALIKKPNICLFDEPLSNLDPLLKDEIMGLIKRKMHEHKVTAIYVTHNVKEAIAIADEIFLMKEGKIIFNGSIDKFINNKNKDVADFVNFGLKNEIKK